MKIKQKMKKIIANQNTKFLSPTTGIEIFLVLVFFLGGWWFLYRYTGGPLSWDELWYMHLSFNPEADPRILNRYFHIYLQKAFFWMAGDPFMGAKLFWSFLISTTASLVYINARIISSQSNYLHGLISVSFFYSQALILGQAGSTYPDITVMMLVTAGLTVYLVRHRFTRYHRLMLALLGIIFFFAFKSKETGIILGIIVLGLGFSESDIFNVKRLVGNMTFVLVGVVIGVVFLMVLDWIFLGDTLFGLRLSHIETLMHFNFGEFARRADNWLDYILRTMPVPFLLSIISIIKKRDCNYKAEEKVVWLLPIGLILFLTLIMIKAKIWVIPRYYLPTVPVIAILGAQFFETETQTKIHALQKNMLKLLGTLSIVFLIYVLINSFVDKSVWMLEQFINAIIFPFAALALILLAILVKKWRFTSLMIVFVCVISITGFPIYKGIANLVKGTVAAKSEKRFAPFAAFSDDVVCSKGVSVFISKNIFKKYGMLSRDEISSQWMFNLYFGCDLELSQFVYSDSTDDLVNKDCTYVYITVGDWEELNYEIREHLDAKYNIRISEKEGVFFLRKKVSIKLHQHSGVQ